MYIAVRIPYYTFRYYSHVKSKGFKDTHQLIHRAGSHYGGETVKHDTASNSLTASCTLNVLTFCHRKVHGPLQVLGIQEYNSYYTKIFQGT